MIYVKTLGWFLDMRYQSCSPKYVIIWLTSQVAKYFVCSGRSWNIPFSNLLITDDRTGIPLSMPANPRLNEWVKEFCLHDVRRIAIAFLKCCGECISALEGVVAGWLTPDVISTADPPEDELEPGS